MNVREIKPCPFCGGIADIRYSINTLVIECTNRKCKIQPSTWLHVNSDSAEKLIKIWNTRKFKEVE